MSLRPRARIHLANIVDNWRTLQAEQVAGTTAAVVKADAYGHGIKDVVEALHDAGCDHFFVAHSFEGEQVRRALGSHPIIYVLNGPGPYEEPLYRTQALTPVINSDHQFQTLVTWLQTGGKLRNGYALHFDTGMNRLGLPVSDVTSIADAVIGMEPTLILSHLACAEDPENGMNAFQLKQFETVTEKFPAIATSLANSGGVWLGKDFHGALTRPGIALYGGGHPPDNRPLKPGMTLEAPILQVRQVAAGETVGYDATYRFEEKTWLATVALGYGDGFPRSASNKGFATIEGLRCPIVGRVSMDLITIDISSALHLARPGVYAQFIGPEMPLEEQATLAGTIGYELTTGLTPRVKRIYN
ncbi:MAG: alanine racemase [Henriciella sp.]|nr:alanine racemase [Henriciella sp.]